MSGQIQYGFETMTAAMPHVDNGEIVAVAQARTRRTGSHPNVPTMQEADSPGFKATTVPGQPQRGYQRLTVPGASGCRACSPGVGRNTLAIYGGW